MHPFGGGVPGPAKEAGYAVTNEYPFDITSTFYDASHYEIEGGIYSHELVSNDFRGITILGEGFTEDELDKFEEKANDFITAFLETDPVSRMTERFCFFIETSMSAQSGITKENGEHKDTYYGFQLNEDGTIGTYRTDTTMDVILLQEVWRRDTNMKTWAQWGATVVLLNEEEEQANLNWRHPESNRSVHLATVADGDYTRLIESLVTQFAHVRSNRDADLLDTYRWMEGPEQNATFEDVYLRLIESCYSHEMYGNPEYNNLPRPVIVSDASTKVYVTDGTQVLNWDVPETFEAYAYGHALQVNTCAEDTFTYRYYTDDNHRVGELLDGPPVEPGYYWAEADLPGGPKFFRDTYTDRYGYTYEAGQALPGVNGDESVANSSTRVRGFVRFQIVEQEEGEPTPVEIQIKLYHNDGKDGYQTIKAVVGQTYEEALNYTPYRRGYRFVGWNTEADGTGERITADSIVQEDVLELYAMWRELPQDDEDDDTPDTDPVIKPGQDDEDPDSKPGGIIVLPEKKLPFVDVLTSDWFYADVEAAWKDGLINGMTATTFEPEGQITLAQAIKLAACMNQKANTGKVTLSNGSPIWYSSYVQYAIEKGIIREGQFTDYDRAATRAEFAQIFAAALPESSYTAMNTVGENKIPDVKISDSYGAAVYKLYRAGILTGNDAQGTFAPNTNIKRSEVAAIVNRMMHTDARISISL